MMIYYFTLCVFNILVLAISTVSTSESNPNKTVLVFGGTGNIGTEVVHHLLQHNYKPTLVSRGNWQYDSTTLIKPHVTHISCDREEQDLSHCSKLMKFIERQNHIDFVIDFSASNPEVVVQAAEVLKGNVGLYIYISADSIYTVCRRPKRFPIKETESVRPDDSEERKRLAEKDTFGDRKLAVEELLIEQRASGGFPYMSLRLPDVIGPRDTTLRWWLLQFWIKYYRIIQTPIYTVSNRTTIAFSLVYTKDIAKAILSAMEAGDIVHDQVYNIGFDEAFEYKDIVESIAKELKEDRIQFHEVEDATHQIYPFVAIGPLDISKIKEHLGFMPTPLEQAVKETVSWYEKAFLKYDDTLETITEFYIEKLVSERKKSALLDAIQKSKAKDEL